MKLLGFSEKFLDLLSAPLGPVVGLAPLPHAHPHMNAALPRLSAAIRGSILRWNISSMNSL